MVSVFELAQCCKAVYDEDPQVEGWHREATYNPPDTGFFAALFLREVANEKGRSEAVLAIRGTRRFSALDKATNLMLALGITPFQYRQARLALLDAREHAHVDYKDFYLTGHSQGGGLAALAGARHKRPIQVVTFNAPGMLRAAVNCLFGLDILFNLHLHPGFKEYHAEFDRVIHIRSEHDPVSAVVGPRIAGNTYTLPNQKCPGVPLYSWLLPPLAFVRAVRRASCAHSMNMLLKLVEAEPHYQEPIRWV